MANTRGLVYSEDGEHIVASAEGALEALFKCLNHSQEFCDTNRPKMAYVIAHRNSKALLNVISDIINFATGNANITFEELRTNKNHGFKALSIVLSQNKVRPVVFSADTAANTKVSLIILAALDKENMYMLKETRKQCFQTHDTGDTYHYSDVDDGFLKTVLTLEPEPISLQADAINEESIITITPSPTHSPEIQPIANPKHRDAALFAPLTQEAPILFQRKKTPPPAPAPAKSFNDLCTIQ